MGRLEDALVDRLLATSAAYKRDVMEETIRKLLGARPLPSVTGIPPRRGKADGGIDGILDVSCLLNQIWDNTIAALNVKVRKTDFTREQLGGFVFDMERESIRVGIIITASKPSPDARCELDRKNCQGSILLVHFRLADILVGNIAAQNILVGGMNIQTILTNNLRTQLMN